MSDTRQATEFAIAKHKELYGNGWGLNEEDENIVETLLVFIDNATDSSVQIELIAYACLKMVEPHIRQMLEQLDEPNTQEDDDIERALQRARRHHLT